MNRFEHRAARFVSGTRMRLVLVCIFFASGGIAVAEQFPGSVLDLSNWRLTLPVDTPRSGKPDEVEQPELQECSDPRSFFVDSSGKGVAFRAHCDGVPTKGSGYPRSELRQMVKNGKKQASWDTDDDDLQSMEMRVAITVAPVKKQHVVCAQIHNADDDLAMIRLEGTKLFVERNSVDRVMLDRHYKMGTPFDLKMQAGGGKVKVWYNGDERMDWKVTSRGCYFKAGCYTQSNLSKGDDASSYGEVVIYRLKIDSKKRK